MEEVLLELDLLPAFALLDESAGAFAVETVPAVGLLLVLRLQLGVQQSSQFVLLVGQLHLPLPLALHLLLQQLLLRLPLHHPHHPPQLLPLLLETPLRLPLLLLQEQHPVRDGPLLQLDPPPLLLPQLQRVPQPHELLRVAGDPLPLHRNNNIIASCLQLAQPLAQRRHELLLEGGGVLQAAQLSHLGGQGGPQHYGELLDGLPAEVAQRGTVLLRTQVDHALNRDGGTFLLLKMPG